MSAAASTPCTTCTTAPAYEGKRCCLLCYESHLLELLDCKERELTAIAGMLKHRPADAVRQIEHDRRHYAEAEKSLRNYEAQLKVVRTGVWPAEPEKKKGRRVR